MNENPTYVKKSSETMKCSAEEERKTHPYIFSSSGLGRRRIFGVVAVAAAEEKHQDWQYSSANKTLSKWCCKMGQWCILHINLISI